MFDHVEIRWCFFDSCQHFYATVLAPPFDRTQMV